MGEGKPMKILVLAGGLSPERDVSLSSGALVANALMNKGHEVALLDLYFGTSEKDFSKLFFRKEDGKTYEYTITEEAPDLDALKEEFGQDLIGEQVLDVARYADVVFLGLHGDIGENGKVQALLDLYHIPYTGSGYVGSLLAMDKAYSKMLFNQAGITTPPDVDLENPSSITFPVVVKPNEGGSSLGVSIVKSPEELEDAIKASQKYSEDFVVESYIKGREFSVGVLDGEVLPPIEIISEEGFYDYKNKYQAGLAREVCPAELTEEETKKVQAMTLKVYELLKLKAYARIDFLLKDGEFYCLEANTLPGMTPTSLIPQEAKAHGIDYEELCERVVLLAKEK